TIPDLGSDLLSVVLRTAIVYLFLVLGFRFLGKREAGQLSTLDLVVLLVIANAVQNAMVGENTSLIAGLIAAAVILLLDLLLHAAADRWEMLRNALVGDRLEVVHQVAPQEQPDPVERVAPVLAFLPAVALVLVPVDLVVLPLDLEGLDHLLGHERDDALVLAAVEDQQRRLDRLGPIDGRAAAVC